MIINCIAIDDEPLALDIIRDYCSRIPFLNLVRTFDNALDSIEFIRSNKVDLIFLDIQMENITGIQLLKALQKRPYVIFTTAYDEYAIQGFELDVVDYMLKPISFERFLKGLNKVSERMQKDFPSPTTTDHSADKSNEAFTFFVKTETRMEKVNSADVLYVEGMGDYWRIVTKTRRIMTLLNARKLKKSFWNLNFSEFTNHFLLLSIKLKPSNVIISKLAIK